MVTVTYNWPHQTTASYNLVYDGTAVNWNDVWEPARSYEPPKPTIDEKALARLKNIEHERELWVRKTYFEPRLKTKVRRYQQHHTAPSRCQKAREKRKMRLQSY